MYTITKPRTRARTKSSFKFCDFSDEVLIHILLLLEPTQWVNLSNTNSKFFRIIKPLLYKRILVCSSVQFQKLEYASAEVMGVFSIDYTIISTKSFNKLLALKPFPKHLIECVFFYWTFPEIDMLDQLDPNCVIEIQDKNNGKSFFPRLDYLFKKTDIYELKIKGSCMDYPSKSTNFDLSSIYNDVVSLRFNEEHDIYKQLKNGDIQFKNLSTIHWEGSHDFPSHLLNCPSLKHVTISCLNDNRWNPILQLLSKKLQTIEADWDFVNKWSICSDCPFGHVQSYVIGGTSKNPQVLELYCKSDPIKYNLLSTRKCIKNSRLGVDRKRLANMKELNIWGKYHQYYKVRGEELIPIFKETIEPI